MSDHNLKRLALIAEGLGELNEEVVYVGGSVAELYVTDPAKTDIRETLDIDCVTQLSSYHQYTDLEEKLRKKGFKNDISHDAPICRWIYKDEIVDIVPDNDEIIGFTNKWYHEAIEKKEKYILNGGTEIYIFPLPYYLATKLEAVRGRGGEDWRSSHDFEDIIYILNYCPTIISSLQDINTNLKKYFKEEFTIILSRKNIAEEISCMLPYGEEERNEDIINIMKKIASL